MTGWAEAYTPRARKVTLVHTGGPADGTRHKVLVTRIPEARYWANPEDRRGRGVQLARYVRHDLIAPWVLRYTYSGTEHRPGPVPAADEDWPEWS